MDQELTEEELQDLYAWLDKIPLSRPKRHITRDFSDGVLAAEVVKHFLPKLVDLHNYTPANSTQQKLTNWDVLNRRGFALFLGRIWEKDSQTQPALLLFMQSGFIKYVNMKVFSKLSLHVPEKTVRKIVLNTAGAIEPALHVLKEKLQKKLEHDGDHTTGLDYYDTRELEKHADITHTEERFLAQLRGGETKNSNLQRAQFYAGVDPTLRQILQEKEETVLALQQTVEILQMKVNRLEHLVHLKDMRIQDLTQHLETYKTKGKA
ncbi:Sperm flagellar protein 1 [Takifugu flavidus]|uniref:Sperm flagellar protein 1 n=1 Tax=Takifugu flavidus TaxID=433684 RepID=A0A5C6PH44_9TELE|nr:Sperm flagellar protein 1 [Takifugu flavidus]